MADHISPWQPMTNKLGLATLGKLAEEAGELSSILARIIIQGIDEADPGTGKLNRLALEDEIADVMSAASAVWGHFGLDMDRIEERAQRKAAGLRHWHRLITKE